MDGKEVIGSTTPYATVKRRGRNLGLLLPVKRRLLDSVLNGETSSSLGSVGTGSSTGGESCDTGSGWIDRKKRVNGNLYDYPGRLSRKIFV